MTRRLASVALLAVALSLTAACRPRAPERVTEWRVRPAGIGPLRVGMTVREASAVLAESLVVRYADIEGCDHIRPDTLPLGVSVMVLSDSIARIEVDTGTVATEEGARIGDSEARILELYGDRVRVEPHHYTGPEGHYLIVETPGDTVHRIVFETDGRHVTLYRAGRRPAVDYVEGCA